MTGPLKKRCGPNGPHEEEGFQLCSHKECIQELDTVYPHLKTLKMWHFAARQLVAGFGISFAA